MYYTFSELKLISMNFSKKSKYDNTIIGDVKVNGRSMPVTRKSAKSMEIENPTLNVINGKIIKF